MWGGEGGGGGVQCVTPYLEGKGGVCRNCHGVGESLPYRLGQRSQTEGPGRIKNFNLYIFFIHPLKLLFNGDSKYASRYLNIQALEYLPVNTHH